MPLFRIVATLTLACLAAGCAIDQKVSPVSGPRIASVCIQQNDEVLMDGFLPALRKQIESRGVATTVFQGDAPVDCRHRLTYTANWQWDLAMYLTYVQIEVRDGDALIGSANYDARLGGLNLEKFGATETKLQPLIAQLFG